MKRFFGSVVAVILSAMLLVGCGGSDPNYADAVPDNAFVVGRVDANLVLQKSGMYNELLRYVKAAMLSEGLPQTFVAVADDPANSGIDIQAPIYLFAEPLNMSREVVLLGAVAKMLDKQKLDSLFDVLQYQSRGEFFRTESDGVTYMQLDSDAAVAYNDVAIIFGYMDNAYSPEQIKSFLTESLNRTVTGSSVSLPGFEGSDAAFRISMQSVLAMLKMQQAVYYDSDVALAINQLEAYSQMKVDMALNFANGSIDFDVQTIDMPSTDIMYNACTDDNLQYIPADAWAVFNSHIMGSEIVKVINTAVSQNANLKSLIDSELRDATDGMMNYNAVMAIAEPLISSIYGDFTVALNGVDALPSYYGEDFKPNAVAVLGVNNRAIFDQASGLLESTGESRKVNPDMYTMDVDGIPVFFGQREQSLFVATSPLTKMSYSATAAPWYAAVKDSYGFAVVNVEALMNNYTIREEISDELRYELGRQGCGYVLGWLDALNYIYYSTPEVGCAKLSIVFKNKEKNSLQLLVDTVKYDIIKELY